MEASHAPIMESASRGGDVADSPREAVMSTLAMILESQRRIESRLEALCLSQPPGAAAPADAQSPEDAAGGDLGGAPRPSSVGSSEGDAEYDLLSGGCCSTQLEEALPEELGEELQPARDGYSFTSLAACSLPSEWPGSVQRRCFGAENTCSSSGLLSQIVLRTSSITSTSDDLIHRLQVAARIEDEFRHGWVLDPHGRGRIFFDLASVIALLYDLIGLPVLLAWDIPSVGVLYAVTACTIAFWTADILVNFATGYHERGVLVMDANRIARHYVQTWFVLDAVVLVCGALSLWLAGVTAEETKQNLRAQAVKFARVAKITRLLRIAGVARLVRMSEVLERFVDRNLGGDLPPMLEAPGLVLFIFYINHVLACCWFGIGRAAPSDTGLSWLQSRIGEDAGGATFDDVGFLYQYSTAMHWSFTQMTPGSIQVNAVNSYERMFTILCLTLGMLFFSSFVSALSAKFMKYRHERQEVTQQLKKLRRLLRDMEIPTSVMIAAQKVAQSRLSVKRPMGYSDVRKVEFLPAKMQKKLHYEMCSRHLSHQIFRWWGETDIAAVQEFCHGAVDYVTLHEHDIVFHANAPAHSTYIVIAGDFKYTQVRQSSRVARRNSSEVSTGSQISEAALWSHWIHVGTFEAKSTSELVTIGVENLPQAVQKSGISTGVFREYGAEYYVRILAARPPISEWPNDLAVSFCSFEEMLPALTMLCREALSVPAQRRLRLLGNGRHRAEKNRLLRELNDGTCSLYLSGDQVIERLVAVIAFRLIAADGRLLAELGTVESESLSAACKLPGGKQRQGESPYDTFKRFASVHPEVDHTVFLTMKSTCERIVRMSSSQVRSVYIRNVYESSWTSSSADVDVSGVTPASSADVYLSLPGGRGLNIMGKDVFPFIRASAKNELDEGWPELTGTRGGCLDNFQFKIYAWLPLEAFEYLQGGKGQKQLSDCLGSAEVSLEQLQGALPEMPI